MADNWQTQIQVFKFHNTVLMFMGEKRAAVNESEVYMNICDVIEHLTNATGLKYNSALIEFRQLRWFSQKNYNAIKAPRNIKIYQLLHILMLKKDWKTWSKCGPLASHTFENEIVSFWENRDPQFNLRPQSQTYKFRFARATSVCRKNNTWSMKKNDCLI